ncbi:MAG TPA: sigma factor-like helix-turn-helix DNA-binding protein [Patescibacteria group bacterium]|nr:sigma factor-like helix-turn-helix DNA-binding protein [Patescibacteria group bacterium]
MANENAKQIVEKAEAMGFSHKDIADICNVSVGTVSRWKSVGKARHKVIAPLEEELSQPWPEKNKLLKEATLEDLAERARELGFRVSFTDINQ